MHPRVMAWIAAPGILPQLRRSFKAKCVPVTTVFIFALVTLTGMTFDIIIIVIRIIIVIVNTLIRPCLGVPDARDLHRCESALFSNHGHIKVAGRTACSSA